MKPSHDILATCLAAENHPHLMEEPEYQEAKAKLDASPELQREFSEAQDFLKKHPVLMDISTMPPDVRQRIAAVLSAHERQPSKKDNVVLGPWDVRRNFAWAACLVLLLAGMAVLSSAFLENRVNRQYQVTLRQMPPQDAFRMEIGRLVNQGFRLEEVSENPNQLVSWLSDQGVPDIDAPDPLMQMTSLGCTTFEAPFGKIAVVCFKTDGEMIHMFVANAEEMGLRDRIPPRKFNLRGRAVKEWSDDDHLYLLVPQDVDAELPEIFL